MGRAVVGVFVVQILVLLVVGKSDLTADRQALLGLRSAVGGRTLLWNVTQQDPCQWAGVMCENGRVTVLRLPGVSLSGELPAGILGNLTRLRTLSLRFNSLSGPLPSDLTSCSDLRNLYLQGNRFSGDLPEFLLTLRDLVRLNLAKNNFSGQIPTGFSNLKRLRTLYLENNQFEGSIPELELPNLVQFNVSNNLLNGSVPESLQSMPESAFLGNLLCGGPLESCPGNGTAPPALAGITKTNKKKKGLSSGALAGIIIGSVVGFLLFLLILFVLFRKKSSKKTSSVSVATIKHPETEIPGEKPAGEMDNGGMSNGHSVAAMAAAAMTANGKKEVSNGGGGGGEGKKLIFFGNGGGKAFDLEDLLRASAEVLGKGTFGTAYKAVLEVGTVVAVKRLKDVTLSEREFREKIESVGAMEDENLVPLRAYYYSIEEKLLVHDYMPMGSLSALLHGKI